MISAACFKLSPTTLFERLLRRYSDLPCNSSQGYHDAYFPLNCEHFEEEPPWGETYFLDDIRWPQRCMCGYEFTETDKRQVFFRRFYERDDGELMTLWEAPFGAMWRAYDDELAQAVTMLKTPLGDVNVHRVMFLRGGEVTGETPHLTCSRPIEGVRAHDKEPFRLWVRNGRLIYGLPQSVP